MTAIQEMKNVNIFSHQKRRFKVVKPLFEERTYVVTQPVLSLQVPSLRDTNVSNVGPQLGNLSEEGWRHGRLTNELTDS